MLNSAGAVVSTQKYWPYGATRSGGITQTDKQYTDQQVENGDAGLGLYNYKARFYSTVLGRFVSADDLAVDGLNRYAYAEDDPTNHTDPSGHCILGLKCEAGDAKNWIHCAFTCGDNWLGDWARNALSSFSFWENVVEGWAGSDTPFAFAAELVSTVANDATQSTLFNTIPRVGFQALGFMAGGVDVNFFAASLNDLLFGTQWVQNLPAGLFLGGSPWWSGETAADMSLGFGTEFRFGGAVSRGFRESTMALGSAIEAIGGPGAANAQTGWSAWQRDLLSGVSTLNVAPSKTDIDANNWRDATSGCLKDASCLNRMVRFFERAPSGGGGGAPPNLDEAGQGLDAIQDLAR